MTVIAQNVSVTYTGTGSVGPFYFNFPISTPAALQVIQNNAILPITAYVIASINNNYDNGGSVTLNSPCPAGQSLTLQRNTPLTQASVFTDNIPQPMQQFEDALDKLTEIDQELAAAIAGGGGGGGQQTFVSAGTGIVVTGTGAIANPYVVSLAIGFSINSFTGGQAGELGEDFVNPAFHASYSGTPTSANITNTDGINSPFNLTTPFTVASITGTFTHSAPANTTYTLTATDGVTNAMANQQISWQERIFGGVGAPGATSTVTASGSTAVLSTGDALPSAQLGPEALGPPPTKFGPYSPSGQCIYLLLTGGSHTFIDAVSGFPFAFNAPTTVSFVNQYGVTLTMYLYQSTNPLYGTFQPELAS